MSRIANKAPPDRERALTTEEAALRHVALLVARGAPTQDVFTAAAEQVARIFERPSVGVMRYDSADSFVVLATWGEHPFPVGSRWLLDGPSAFEAVLRTGRPAAVSDYTGLPGTVAEAAREAGIVGGFGAPIVVDGSTWGVIAVPATRAAPVPEGAETRLGVFTELVATAISNATARDELSRLAAEQAALRRIATLVARESSPVEVFVAVCEEVRRILGSEAAGLLRFEPGGTATLVAQSETPWDPPPLGTSFTLDGENVVTQVFNTARAARADDWTDSTGAVAGMATVLGVRSAVAAPVIVEGRLWGTIIAATSQDEPLPNETERRIGQFTELIATAIANAEARDARAHLVEEQAALRRVATLVAQQPSPEAIFEIVSVEVARVFGFDADPASPDIAGVVRFEPGPALVAVGASKLGEAVKLGVPFPADELYVSSHVLRTGRSARVGPKDLDSVGGATADWFRHYGLLSQVGSPIVVEGRLWGAMTVNSGNDLPADTEERLERFTNLIATAIANAETRDARALLAEEQAALRRVATLVADGIGPEGVFPAVAAEVEALFGADVSAIVRFEEDGVATVLGDVGGPHASGKRVMLDPGYAVDRVRETQHSARFDTDDPTAANMPSIVQAVGIRSAVASPIVVDGKVWGAITAASIDGPLAPGAERRLSEFTELVATAVSNTQAQAAVRTAAEEQAALRRVATLVAVSTPPAEVFAAVTREIARVLDANACLLARADQDGVVVVGTWTDDTPAAPPGFRIPRGGTNLTTMVLDSGRPSRLDSYDAASGDAAEVAHSQGVRSAVGAPILVEGRLWGLVIAGSSSDEPLAAGSEDRLAEFTELVATAIANTESRQAIERVAAEQAALRRVATLVAVEASQDEIFTAIAEGVAGAVGEELRLVRYEGDVAVVVAGSEGPHLDVLPVGTRLPVGGNNTLSLVFRTGEPVRFNDYSSASGPIAEAVKPMGLRSIVGAPVVVEGRTWGAMIVGTFGDEPVPPGTEDRLGQFAELMATSIANTESRAELSRLLEDQAALRRVAILVADQAEPGVIFASVAEEVAQAVAGERCAIGRFEDNDALTVIAYWSHEEQKVPIGASFDVGNDEVVAAIRESGRLLRIDDHEAFSGPLMDYARTLGSLPSSTIAAPLFVGGRMWGIIFTSTMAAVLPEGTELRIVDFAELVATAIVNAEARTEVERLAEQQSALRRVATLVARRDAPDLVFRAATQEAGALLGADISALVRFETEDTVTVMAGPPLGPYAAGERVALDRDFVVYAVRETGRPARFETDDPTADGMPDLVRRLGIRSALASPILVEGDLWGAMILGSYADSFSPETEQRLDDFSELVATGISNASARAELVASRARIVAAGDEARRRIERNLHDGTQQRLIALGLDLQGVRAGIPKEQSNSHVALEAVEEDLEGILEDLRELSHGLHPPLLSRLGLGPSVQALARRSPIPVHVKVDLPERPAETLETAVYYVVSEALTNAMKHSQATEITVTIGIAEAKLCARIADNGIGGADPGGGSGLTGLRDRVDALGGRFSLHSGGRDGTTISVELPAKRAVAS